VTKNNLLASCSPICKFFQYKQFSPTHVLLSSFNIAKPTSLSQHSQIWDFNFVKTIQLHCVRADLCCTFDLIYSNLPNSPNAHFAESQRSILHPYTQMTLNVVYGSSSKTFLHSLMLLNVNKVFIGTTRYLMIIYEYY
jgi:hypothetical protein